MMRERKLCACCAMLTALGLLPVTSLIFTRTWDAGGSDNNWSTGVYWRLGGLAQTRSADNVTSNIVTACATQLTPLFDVPYSIRTLSFDDRGGVFVIVGVAELTIN